MPQINNVEIREIRDIQVLPVNSIFTGLPIALPQSPPVTVTIGSPIVDIPGCVEYNPNGPGVIKDDPNGTYTICDATVPSFNPIEYNPNEMVMTGPPEPESEFRGEQPDNEISDIPKTSIPQVPQIPTVKIEKEKKEETIEIVEEPGWVEEYLPSAQEVSTTVTIAVAAAGAAVFGKPLAELLLKLIKPAVKKVISKIKDIRGVEDPVLSVQQRRQLQRDLRKE
jgi:hypothetical protein